MAVTLLVSSVSFNAYAENASGSCGSNVSWLFNAETGELIISGTGSMADYSAETAPWKDYNDKITSVVVEEGITALWTNNRSQPFNGITQRFTVSLPSTLEKIERDFNSCTNLTAVTFPEKGVLEKVDGWAFSGCSSLESIVFPIGDEFNIFLQGIGHAVSVPDAVNFHQFVDVAHGLMIKHVKMQGISEESTGTFGDFGFDTPVTETAGDFRDHQVRYAPLTVE